MANDDTLFYLDEADVFPYKPISNIWLLILTSLSFVIFFIIDRRIKSTFYSTNQYNFKENWLKHNTLISFIHSCLCSILVIFAVIYEPEMLQDPYSHINFVNYSVIAFSSGYFVWDFIDCLRNSTSSTFAILFHHTIVLLFLNHALIHTRNMGYCIYGLALEINSVFLHARRLLRWYTPFSTSIYFKKFLKIVIDLGNYFTLIVFRFGMVIVGLEALFRQHYRVNTILFMFLFVSIGTIGVLNIVLFYRLIKNQFFRKKTNYNRLIEDNILVTDNNILIPS